VPVILTWKQFNRMIRKFLMTPCLDEVLNFVFLTYYYSMEISSEEDYILLSKKSKYKKSEYSLANISRLNWKRRKGHNTNFRKYKTLTERPKSIV